MEHRWGQRVEVGMKVRFSCLPYAIGTGRLRDISVSGAFIETTVRPPLFARVHVEIILPTSARTKHYSVAAHITRHAPDGIGIEWLVFAPAAVAHLLKARATEALIDGDLQVALKSRATAAIASNAIQPSRHAC